MTGSLVPRRIYTYELSMRQFAASQISPNLQSSTWKPSPPGFAMKNCTICQGTGWQILPVPGMSTARRCSCTALSHILRLKERVRIPQRYENCTFDTFVPLSVSQARALKETQKFAGRFPRCGSGLFLMGDSGVGKTHLAISVLHELVQKFQDDLLFVDFPTMSDGSKTARRNSDPWQALKTTSLLVLDNFGATSSRADEPVPLWEDLLRFRYRRCKPVIFTSERIHFDELFANSLSGNISEAESFLRQLHPSLLYGLFSRIKILLISSSEFCRQSSQIAPLF